MRRPIWIRGKKPRVTVIVHCHNIGAALREALASLLSQEPCAVTVVDTGSDARATRRVLSRLRLEGVSVLSVPNARPSAARNVGLWCASTRYVFPLDAGATLASWALTGLADALDASGADLAWGDEETFGAKTYRRSTPSFYFFRQKTANEIPDAMIRRDTALLVGGW